MEQYKKTEGDPIMPEIDFEDLAKEIEKRMDNKKYRFNTSLYDVLREKGIKAKFWPEIIEKTSDIIKKKRPELFPKSWVKEKKESHSFKITPEIMRGARAHEFKNIIKEDKDREEE